MSLREIDRAFSNVNGAFTDAVGMCAHIIMIIISRFSIGGCVFYAASYLGYLEINAKWSLLFFHFFSFPTPRFCFGLSCPSTWQAIWCCPTKACPSASIRKGRHGDQSRYPYIRQSGVYNIYTLFI